MKKIKIKDIVEDPEIYPRQRENWMTVVNYTSGMKSGAEFPPIAVMPMPGNKFLLLDGKHRLEASKNIKKNEIDAIIREDVKTKKDAIKIAYKLNMAHGLQLSPFDKRRAVIKLENLDFTEVEIGEILQMPLKELKTFTQSSFVVNTVTGEKTALKANIQHLANREEGTVLVTEAEQENLSGKSQISLVEELIYILKTDDFLKEDRMMLKKLIELRNILNEVLGDATPKSH